MLSSIGIINAQLSSLNPSLILLFFCGAKHVAYVIVNRCGKCRAVSLVVDNQDKCAIYRIVSGTNAVAFHSR